MTWLIVVGAIVVVALAVHLYEERKSRAALLARKARPSNTGRVSHTRSLRETWELDLKAMVAVLTRIDERGVTEATLQFQLVRNADGNVEIDPSTAPHWSIPTAVAALARPGQRGRL